MRLSNLIACRKHILRGHQGEIVSPSHLNDNWLRNYSLPDLKSVKLLNVGRLRVEKGIFSLFKILENSNINLTVVTSEKEINLNEVFKNINILSFENYNDTIIKFYDENNIFSNEKILLINFIFLISILLLLIFLDFLPIR